MKDRVVDETPLEKEEHSYFRTQVGRLLVLSVLRPDLQDTVGQLARHASAPTVSDRIALKRLIRCLSTTCNVTLGSLSERPFGAYGSGRCGLGWYCRAQVGNGRRGAFGCCVTSWSRTQASDALSSCEAELYSMGSAAVEVLGYTRFWLRARVRGRTASRIWRQLFSVAFGESHRCRTLETRARSTVGYTVMGCCWTATLDDRAKC